MSEDDDLPRLLSGRYRLEATLGHGGMGVVYRATDLLMKRPVAVKLIRAVDGVELDDEIAGRFLREAKNTARLQHEHIIEVFDLGRSDEGGLYFVMELLEGESLSARLRRDGKLTSETTVHIARQICDALQVAHMAGVVHRDLKPANVMLLSRAGDDEFVKVLDFGVAKSIAGDQDTQLTHTGMLVGTVDYMAPEQIMGKPVDGRTDVYALGVVLYKMLSGRPPFRDTGVPALIHAHLNTMPQPLIEATADVPNELDRVVLRCLAKNPDRRFESMAELSRALAEAAMRGSAGLVDLEYGREDDIYGQGDETAVARSYPGLPQARRRSIHDALADDATVNDRVQDLEDATVRLDRPMAVKPPPMAAGLPPIPRGAVSARGASSAPPVAQRPPFAPLLHPEGLASSNRVAGEDLRRSEPKICAMCQTANAPHVPSCVACGVSLARDDQAAVRERVRTGSPHMASAPGAHLPPPISSAYDIAMHAAPPPPHPSSSYGVPSPLHHGMPSGVGWLPHQPPPPSPPRSMWERFLTWTGLRGR